MSEAAATRVFFQKHTRIVATVAPSLCYCNDTGDWRARVLLATQGGRKTTASRIGKKDGRLWNLPFPEHMELAHFADEDDIALWGVPVGETDLGKCPRLQVSAGAARRGGGKSRGRGGGLRYVCTLFVLARRSPFGRRLPRPAAARAPLGRLLCMTAGTAGGEEGSLRGAAPESATSGFFFVSGTEMIDSEAAMMVPFVTVRLWFLRSYPTALSGPLPPLPARAACPALLPARRSAGRLGPDGTACSVGCRRQCQAPLYRSLNLSPAAPYPTRPPLAPPSLPLPPSPSHQMA